MHFLGCSPANFRPSESHQVITLLVYFADGPTYDVCTSEPLLTRNEVTALFSRSFIDIWNFYHTFFAALFRLAHPSAPTSNHNTPLSSLPLAYLISFSICPVHHGLSYRISLSDLALSLPHRTQPLQPYSEPGNLTLCAHIVDRFPSHTHATVSAIFLIAPWPTRFHRS